MPFKKGQSGNPKGKPLGAKSDRSRQWEALADSITGVQSERFNDYINELWDGDKQSKALAADFYLKTLEYFKPKQSRQEVRQDGAVQHEVIVTRREDGNKS